MPEAAQQVGHEEWLAAQVTTPWSAARSSGVPLAGLSDERLLVTPRLAAAAAAMMSVAGRLQEAAMRGAPEAAEQQAGPVGPTALSSHRQRGPSPAVRAEPVRSGPYWDRTAQEGPALRAVVVP